MASYNQKYLDDNKLITVTDFKKGNWPKLEEIALSKPTVIQMITILKS